MHIQHDQLRGRRVQSPGESHSGKVHQQSRRCERNGGNAVGIPAERQERGRRRQRPVFPDLGGELPCCLHLLFRELRKRALRYRRQYSIRGEAARSGNKVLEADGRGTRPWRRQHRGTGLLAGQIFGHAAYPVVPERELPDHFRGTGDR